MNEEIESITTTNVDALQGEVHRLHRSLVVAIKARDDWKANCGRMRNALEKIKLCPEGAWTIAHEALAPTAAEQLARMIRQTEEGDREFQ